MKRIVLNGFFCMVTAIITGPVAAQSNPLIGSWRLIAADKILPDGRQVADYGSAPNGIAIFTINNHYAVEIYRASGERIKFASGSGLNGTPEEYKDAILSSSCHFGTYAVDTAKNTITFNIDAATFPNNDHTSQVRPFTLKGDTLSWRVKARPDGSVPVSVFKRIN